jgi:hypothetical protein
MTPEQKAKEIIEKRLHGIGGGLPETIMYVAGWEALIDDISQALREAETQGLANARAKLESIWPSKELGKHIYNLSSRTERNHWFDCEAFIKALLSGGEK